MAKRKYANPNGSYLLCEVGLRNIYYFPYVFLWLQIRSFIHDLLNVLMDPETV